MRRFPSQRQGVGSPLSVLLAHVSAPSPRPFHGRHITFLRALSSVSVSGPGSGCPVRRFSTGVTAPLPRLPVFEAIARHDPTSTVVVHSRSGRQFRYGELLADVRRLQDQMLDAAGRRDIRGERVAFLVENGYDYVVTLLAILAARAIAVPLSPAFPAAELQYVVDHSEALLVLSSAKFAAKAQELLATELASRPTHLPLTKHVGSGCCVNEKVEFEAGQVDASGAGMMLYTSGTTNRPKGVLLPEHVMTAQAHSLAKAWEYASTDHLLHVLPLHHIHGIINALYTPLFSGSSIEFMFPFNADAVWRRFAAPFLPVQEGGNSSNIRNISPKKADVVTLFTAVPAIYSRLLATHKQYLQADHPALAEAARTAVSPAHLRLALSGSAALPAPVQQAWVELSHGNVLLERYGMTEVGMALSCGLELADRVDGSVGWPLPLVEARLVDVDTGTVIAPGEEMDAASGRERAGEIQLRGPTIFAGYWRNPEATEREFVKDEAEDKDAPGPNRGRPWFKTGDVAVRRHVPTAGRAGQAGGGVEADVAATHRRPSQDWTGHGSMYFILGRRSADIIKTAGEKVSALEVERELLSLPNVAEAAVVAVPTPITSSDDGSENGGQWGEKVGAVVVLRQDSGGRPVPATASTWSALDMRRALKNRLASYKIPQLLRVVDQIPRNAMGKVNKRQLVAQVFPDYVGGDKAKKGAAGQ